MSKFKAPQRQKSPAEILRSMFNDGEKNFLISIERTIRFRTDMNKDEVSAFVAKAIGDGLIYQNGSVNDVPLWSVKY